MNKITANLILAQVAKSSTTQTSVDATHKATATPSGTQSGLQTELQRSNRSRTRSARAKEGGYDETLAANKQRSARAKRTRTRKQAKSSHAHSDTESVGSKFMQATSETDDDCRNSSRSPTPFATADEPEAQTTRAHLKEQLTRKFHQVIEDSGTQTLMEVDSAISTDPAYASQPEEQDLEARFLPPVPVGPGGGFHLDHPTHLPRGEVFLGYPHDQGSHHSPNPILQDNNSASPQPINTHSPTPSLTRELLSEGTSNFHRPRREDSATHISTSSKSLGDPIPTPSPTPNHGGERPVPLLGSTLNIPNSESQQSRRSLQSIGQHQTGPEQRTTPAQPQPKRPLATPATPLPARKRPATTARSTIGGKAYNGRLNIVEIGLARVSTSGGRSREASRHRTPSQTQQKGKGTARARTRPRTPTTPAPQETRNNDFDLLDGLDVDQFVVDSAAKGVLVDKPGYQKPTVHDLPGYERAIWKDVLEVTWAFSMGEGNFQTRGVYASWTSACFVKVLEFKLPSLDPVKTTMSDDMMTVVLNNLCNQRYNDLLRLRDPVRSYFRLKNPSTNDECQATKNRVKEIYPDYFHYKDIDNLVDPYEGEILFMALESLFYYGPGAIGSKYPALFQRSNDAKDERKHLAVLAYLATMIQFCLEEWSEGFFEKGTLDATTQHSVWLCHFDGLKNVSLIAPGRLVETYNEWIQNAYNASQAKAKFSKKRYVQNVVRPQDVRPDTPTRRLGPHDNN
ncbi:unnamed protein product [Rhizoctonia solani]|uniref:DUF6532 domain-containing protein n=1 Tax=Rhizoctonia solani TaxID=456999 RepID=A0A8H3HT35_9AGAM|nr:unnamed protein product [Rhizoctonia solani]